MEVVTNDKDKCELALGVLKYVLDPEIGLNVVDLGLIYQIDFDDADRKVYTTMTLTTQFCPMGESIVDGVTRALESTFKDSEIKVSLTFSPPWSQANISEEGVRFLNG